MSTVDCTNLHQFSYDPVSDVAFRTLDFMGFPGYRVGDDGSVWTRHRQGRAPLDNNWRSMKRMPDKHRFSRIRIRLHPSRQRIALHRLVLMAFIGPCPPGMEACHFPDANPSNCRLVNLRWDTKLANSADAEMHGTKAKGERIRGSKLTESNVREIRAMEELGGYSRKELAAKFRVTDSAIWCVVHRKNWKWVT